MLLTDRKILKAKKGRRSQEAKPLAAAGLAKEDGRIRGRAEDGSEIKGRIVGKLVARQIMEKEAKRRK